MEKYKNDGKPYRKKVSKKDARTAAEAWGEGNQSLTDLLEVCIENGILTRACCAGHIEEGKVREFPYICFENQKGISSYLLEKVKSESSLKIILICRNPISKKIDVSFHGDYQEKGEFFRAILGYVQDYIHYNGPIEKMSIKGFARGIASKRYESKKIEEKDILTRILNIMSSSNLKGMIIYNARLKLFDIPGKVTLPEDKVEEYLKTIATQEPEKQTSSVIKAVKNICQSAKVGINEIGQVARKLHERSAPQNIQLEEAKEKDE